MQTIARRITAIVVPCLLLVSVAAMGATLNVPGDYATIQAAINAANPAGGDIIQIAAGTYVENLTVTNPVEMAGAGAATTIIEPALSAPNPAACSGASLCTGASNVILVQANNVTIHDLTVDGDNPGLTSGIVANGADIDARNGIITNHNAGTFNNLVVYNCTVENIYLRGIYASSGGTFNFHDNTVQNVAADQASIGIFNFGGGGAIDHNTVSLCNDAISANWSTGTTFTNNTVTNSGSGVHTDNASGPTADLIQANTVSNSMAGGYGVWVFVPYVAPTVTGNTITNVDVALCAAGLANPVSPVFSSNTVNGQSRANSVGFYITTSEFGFGDANVAATFTSNSITGTATGIVIEQTTDANTIALTARFNRIAGNATGVQTVFGKDNNGNLPTTWNASNSLNLTDDWWGCNAGPGSTGCNSLDTTVSGPSSVTVSPWLLLSISASPTTVPASGGTATATVDMVHDSTPADTSPGGVFLPDGISVDFTATLGTMNPTSAPTASGVATSVFTAGATQGPASLTATVDGQNVSATVTVANPVPVITSLSPSNEPVGTAGPVILTVDGTGFVSGSVINWNGSPLGTFYNSDTEIYTLLMGSNLAAAGIFPVTVTNPAPTGGTSNAVNFTVNNPAAVLTSISPMLVAPGGPGFTLTADGSGFVSGATIYWDGSPLTTTYVSGTQLTAAVPAANVASAGTYTVQVKNPSPNLGDSGSLTFTVSAPTTVYVDASWSTNALGTDPDGAGPATSMGWDAFTTVQAAVYGVADGGTIHVAAGTYPGTIDIENRTGIAIVGAGRDTTIFQPTSTLGWNLGGYGNTRQVTLRVVSSTGINISGVTLDLSVVRGNSVSGLVYWDSTGVLDSNRYENVSPADTSSVSSLVAHARAVDPPYTATNRASVSFTNSDFVDTGRVALNVHNWVNVTVTGNIFRNNVNQPGTFGYAMEIGSTATGTVSGNTISGYDVPASDGSESAGIYIENAFTDSLATPVDKPVTVTNNEIKNCQFGLWIGDDYSDPGVGSGPVHIITTLTGNRIHDLASTDPNQPTGGLYMVDVNHSLGSSNTLTASGNSWQTIAGPAFHFYTQGDGALHAAITGDTATGCAEGFLADELSTASTHSSIYDLALHFCRIAGNSGPSQNLLNSSYYPAPIQAQNDWWGCNYGPGGSGTGCSGSNGVSGLVTVDPWLVLTLAASPSSVNFGGTSNLLAGFLTDNHGSAVVGGTIPDGTPVAFAGSLGAVASTLVPTSAGQASTVFTAGTTAGIDGASTTVDGQTLTAVTVDNPAPALTSLSPSLLAPGQPGFTLTVNGTGFLSGATVYWNGSPCATTFGSATLLTAAIPAADVAAAGTYPVTVQNPAPTVGASNALNFSVAVPNPVWVNGAWAGTDPGASVGGHTFGYDAFATVQDGVNAVATSGTVNVAAGNYAQNLTVTKALSLVGPNAGTTGYGTRVAEAVLMPSTVGTDVYNTATSTTILRITAADVTVSGFTFDGDNPALTGVTMNGVNVDACAAISTYASDAGNASAVGNITISDNVIKNFTYAGVDLESDGTTAVSGSAVTDNAFDNLSPTDTPVSPFGIAVVLYDDHYADVTGNHVTQARKGVQTGNFHLANPGSPVQISGNVIESWKTGIWHNLQYQSASPFQIFNNTLTAAAGSTENIGLRITSIQSAVSADIHDNAVAGGLVGVEVWNVPTTAGITLAGDSVTGAATGLLFTNDEYGGYGMGSGGSLTLGQDGSSKGVSITGCTAYGIRVWDDPTDTQPSPNLSLAGAGVTLTGDVVGIQVENARASASITDSDLSGNSSFGANNLGGTLSATCDWWGDATGPNNATTNPSGAGDPVSDGVVYWPWSTTAGPTYNCSGCITPAASNDGPVCEGGTLNLTATTIMGASYSWTGPNGFTSTQQNPSIVGVTAAAGGTYTVTVTAGSCVTSATTAATVNTAPAITGGPQPVTVCQGGSASFSVAATGAGLTYQWFKAGTPDVPVGAGNPYTIPTVSPSDAGNYYVVVSGTCGVPATSATAALTVIATPPAAVYVDTAYTGLAAGTTVTWPNSGGSGTHIIGCDAFATIQDGVNAVGSGGTVNIANGSYYESNIAVTKAMTITGQSQAGVVIGPALTDGHIDSTFQAPVSNGFLLQSGNVTIQGLTLDGNAGGAGVTGDHNYREAIVTDSTTAVVYNAITVQNVTVQHAWRRGIQFYSSGSGTQSTGILVTGCTVTDVSSGNPAGAYCVGIVGFDTTDTTFSDNTISSVFSGIEVVQVSATGGAKVTLQGNTISQADTGIQLVVPADGTLVGGPQPANGNTISVLDGPDGDIQNFGVIVRDATGTVTVQNNGLSAPGKAGGLALFHSPDAGHPAVVTANTFTASASASPAAGRGTGIFMSDDGRLFPDGDGTPVPDQAVYATIQGDTLVGFANAVHAYRNGQNPQVVSATVTLSTVAGNVNGVVFQGGAQGSVNNNDLSANSTFGIDNLNVSGTIDGSCNWWGSSTGPTNPTNPLGTGSPCSAGVGFTPWAGTAGFTCTNPTYEPPSLSSPDISGPYAVGVQQAFSVTLTNPSNGASYAHVRVNFRISNTVLSDITSLQYSDGTNWYPMPLVQSGSDVTGYFGPSTGFAMGVPYGATTPFQVTFATGKTYAITITLVDLDHSSTVLATLSASAYVCSPPGSVGPTLMITKPDSTHMYLTWQLIPNATSYVVWRADDPQFTQNVVQRGTATGNLNGLSLAIANEPANGYYKVQAFNGTCGGPMN